MRSALAFLCVLWGCGVKEKPAPHLRPDLDWTQEHERLWKELVPRSGQADTVQGEITRIAGKLTDEAYRNGNLNWDRDCETMWRWLAETLDDPRVFDPERRRKIRATAEEIIRNHRAPDTSGAGSTYYFLSEMAVRWCLATPELRPRTPDARYTR